MPFDIVVVSGFVQIKIALMTVFRFTDTIFPLMVLVMCINIRQNCDF